jgi:hypothetical protein
MVTLLAASEQNCEDRANALWASLILCGVNCIPESQVNLLFVADAEVVLIVDIHQAAKSGNFRELGFSESTNVWLQKQSHKTSKERPNSLLARKSSKSAR